MMNSEFFFGNMVSQWTQIQMTDVHDPTCGLLMRLMIWSRHPKDPVKSGDRVRVTVSVWCLDRHLVTSTRSRNSVAVFVDRPKLLAELRRAARWTQVTSQGLPKEVTWREAVRSSPVSRDMRSMDLATSA